MDYEKQAQNFLDKTNTKIEIQFLKWDYHFQDDNEKRDIYKITLNRGERKFSFNFGQSIVCSGEYTIINNGTREKVHLKVKKP